MTRIGVIGGSGVYAIDGLQNARWEEVETPWGNPSDALLIGQLEGQDMAFLPRHGRGHRFSPSDVPYRANIAALKSLGVQEVISVSACGSFREEMAPGDFVILDQFIDRTVGRAASFFGAGCVAHVSLAHPTCARLGDALETAAAAAAVPHHRGGTYLAMEGPQFSTKAESLLFRDQFGADVIGMTNMPEARLAREAELCYAPVAMVTDYDSWHPDHGSVDITAIIATLTGNTERAHALLRAMAKAPARVAPCPCGCDRALDHAIMTAPDVRDPDLTERLRSIASRVL